MFAIGIDAEKEDSWSRRHTCKTRTRAMDGGVKGETSREANISTATKWGLALPRRKEKKSCESTVLLAVVKRNICVFLACLRDNKMIPFCYCMDGAFVSPPPIFRLV